MGAGDPNWTAMLTLKALHWAISSGHSTSDIISSLPAWGPHLGNHVLQLHRHLLLLLFNAQFRGRKILYCLYCHSWNKAKIGAVWLQWKPASHGVRLRVLRVWSGQSSLSISFLFPSSGDGFSPSLWIIEFCLLLHSSKRERHNFHVTSQAVLLRPSKSIFLPHHFCQASNSALWLACLVTVQCHHYPHLQLLFQHVSLKSTKWASQPNFSLPVIGASIVGDPLCARHHSRQLACSVLFSAQATPQVVPSILQTGRRES